VVSAQLILRQRARRSLKDEFDPQQLESSVVD
jgi:hypothetical protein